MRVMTSHPFEREHTMTHVKSTQAPANLKALMAEDKDFLREIVRETMQQLLEAEMTDTIGAESGERSESRLGYGAGHYPRTLVTRVGKLELRVPRDRDGRFSTELFERYQRSEKALVSALAEMYVQGVSTRKVKAITEELCGHSFSASAISQINKGLDKNLSEFASRRLEEPYPYVILDARYEKVREGGVIRSQAVFIGIGINQEGYRQVLGVELAGRESQTSWRDFLATLRDRGLHGVEFVVSDAHEGLRKSLMEMLPEAAWQRCYVHFLRNALDHLPARPTTTACRNCGGSTTAGTYLRPRKTSQPGSAAGRRPTPSSATGWRRTSPRPLPSTGCPAATTSISRAPTCWSGCTRRSNGAPGS
jgi:putative transposase